MDGGQSETPLWLPEQRAVIFADGMTAPGGELRVWDTPWHEERVLPALRALLELPFEYVIVSHGEPVHTRAAYERALELSPWSDRTLAFEETKQRCIYFLRLFLMREVATLGQRDERRISRNLIPNRTKVPHLATDGELFSPKNKRGTFN
jgi:glyoxylase-like metal-dependent hydrolase (beta-lactamase superfamily II)